MSGYPKSFGRRNLQKPGIVPLESRTPVDRTQKLSKPLLGLGELLSPGLEQPRGGPLLEDPEIIEALCDAAAAGVPIELIDRGFCCLRPAVPGRTEALRVRSIIGRFLEHSRIFHFAARIPRTQP